SPARRFFTSRSIELIPSGCFSSIRMAPSLSANTALSSSKAWRTTIQYKVPRPHESRSAAQKVKSRTNCVAMERGSVRLEDITYAANSVDEFLLEWIVNFGAQSADDAGDNVCVGSEMRAQDMIADILARSKLA